MSMKLQDFNAGDTLNFDIEVPDKFKDGYTYTYYLKDKNGNSITISSNSTHFFVSSSTTSTYIPGMYSYVLYAEKNGERYKLYEDIVNIKADITTANTYDNRTHAQKVLDSINAILENKDEVEEYTIGGRSIKRMSIDELLKWKKYYTAEVQKEKNKQNIRYIKAQF